MLKGKTALATGSTSGIGKGIAVLKSDIAYGPDERHKLDVITPAQKPAQAAPVVIFIHGGAYVRGNKTVPGTPFYQNIAAFWARNGIIGVNATYRLAPKHQWPAAAQDISAAAKWTRANIAAYGGDPNRIVLMGPIPPISGRSPSYIVLHRLIAILAAGDVAGQQQAAAAFGLDRALRFQWLLREWRPGLGLHLWSGGSHKDS